jgi:hypothetical protein
MPISFVSVPNHNIIDMVCILNCHAILSSVCFFSSISVDLIFMVCPIYIDYDISFKKYCSNIKIQNYKCALNDLDEIYIKHEII